MINLRLWLAVFLHETRLKFLQTARVGPKCDPSQTYTTDVKQTTVLLQSVSGTE